MPTIKVGITIFGEPSGYPTDTIITEFKSFIQSNSGLVITTIVNRYPALSSSELYHYTDSNTWFIDRSIFSTYHKSLLPRDIHSNIVLYNWLGLAPTIQGGTWGADGSPNYVPFSGIPIGVPGWGQTSPFYLWTYALSQVLTHEWFLSLNSILKDSLGYTDTDFPNPENASAYGYTEMPTGWQSWYIHLLSLITPGIYASLDVGSVRFHTNPGTCEIWRQFTTTEELLGTTDSSGSLLLQNRLVGNLAYKVKKSGYTDSPVQISAIKGGTITDTLTITINQLLGTVFFQTSPGEAEIWNYNTNTLIGTTYSNGLAMISLPIGSLTYFVKKIGYYNSTNQTITVIANTTVVAPLMTLTPIPTTGSVRFHTSPGGVDIWKGTTKLGTTDSIGILLVPNLSVGALNYVAKRIGYYDSSTQSVTVIENIIVDTQLITLTQKTGSVDISSTPSGAKIYIDGIEQIGLLTPITISGLSQSPPNHIYKLMLTGYEDAIGTFDIIADQTTTVPTIVLTHISPITGTVIIISNPSGAKIYIDNIEQIGRLTPSTVANISPSPPSHTYRLTLTGYNDKSDSFDISPGEIKMIGVGNLTPIVVQAGFGPVGMILVAGLIVGAIYSRTQKKGEVKIRAT